MKLQKSVFPIVAWFVLIGSGFFFLFLYENNPGLRAPQDAPPHWPAAAGLSLTDAPYTLVMGIHPHCPCTRATLSELERILAHSRGKLKGYFFLDQPSGFSGDWMDTDTTRRARRFPGMQALPDPRGRKEDLFHLTVSGQVLVYDQNGDLLFNGGITSSRAHEGDNRGENAIKELLVKGKTPFRETPFFGCALFNNNKKMVSDAA